MAQIIDVDTIMLMVDIPAMGMITDVNILVDLEHNWLADLDVSVSHGATSVSLFTDIVDIDTFTCLGDDMLATLGDARR